VAKGLKNRIGEVISDDLDSLLEAREELVKSNSSYAQRQLEKSKKRLLNTKKVSMEEIEKVCKLQEELTKLEQMQEQEFEARQEISQPN